MPKSKSKRRSYQPPPKKKRRPSPRWFGPLILGLMGVGILMIILNYLGVMPGLKGGQANNSYLFGGLSLIAAGFLLATFWR